MAGYYKLAETESEIAHNVNVRSWPLADITNLLIHVRFSNRPFGVKHFQTIHRCSVDVAHGLVLLFGIGTKALPSWDSKTRWNNLLVGLAVKRTVGPSGHANSPHPSSREGHLSTASLIGRLRSSTFRLSAAAVSMSPHGLALLFGIGTRALPSWDSRMR